MGSGSMTPEILQMQIAKCKMATSRPFRCECAVALSCRCRVYADHC
ncbi:MAG: hypothetical protein MZV63_41435 [Marinilabiliales bacterium]|nr:hypothetical protein [Marinilabiliales bacterium]